ncbi:MAG: uracil-DNA glycosylase [Alphaproteobacteria bacterium]
MKIKNIKSFIDFYKTMNVSVSISQQSRFESLKKNTKEKKQYIDEVSLEPNNKESALKQLYKEIETSDCNLKDIATNLVFSDGNKDSNIMLIGEAPAEDEDKLGKPFVGQAGKLLDKMFRNIDLIRSKNFYVTNVVFWRPPGNRTPNKNEINICLPLTKSHIKIINPKLIILLGNVAAQSILNTDLAMGFVKKKRSFLHR